MRIVSISTEWLDQLLDVPSATPDVRRRARLLNILLFGLGFLSFLAIVVVFAAQVIGMFTLQEGVETYVPASAILVGIGIVYAINRYWSEQVASSLFLAMLTLVFYFADSPYESVWGRNMIIMAIPVLIASVILHPNASFVVAGFVGALSLAAAYINSFEPNLLGVFAYFSVAFVSWLSSRSLERAVKDLRVINAELDQRVAQRTAELQETNVQLEREVMERKRANEALAIARDQALAASRLKSELLANVSHELRTALTELVGDLLDQAQLDAGRLKLHNVPFDPRELTRGVRERLEILANEKGLTLNCEVASEIPPLLVGDASRLEQIMINLVGNAIKFTQQGYVTISVYLPGKNTWAIAVKDTGPGIPESAQVYIFDAFRQVDGSVTRQHEGSGLGLSIVQQLATFMKGEVTLESTLGQGSVFTVILPLIVPAQEKTA
jgi:signal transduction histidine kinase